MGCDYLQWGGGGHVDFDLDTVTRSARTQRLLRFTDLVYLEVWKVGIYYVDDSGSINDCSCSDNLHPTVDSEFD